MSDDHSLEDLSSLIDGELDTSQTRFLFSRLDHDEALRSGWNRYHVIGAAMRSEAPGRCSGLASRVALALEDEAIDRREPFEARPGTSRKSSWLRPVAGVAVAASVAIAAYGLLASAPIGNQASAPAANIAAAPADNPNFDVVQGLPPRISTASGNASGSALSLTPQSPQQITADPRMQAYLLRHNEAAVGHSQGLVPYIYMIAAPEEVQGANDKPAAGVE